MSNLNGLRVLELAGVGPQSTAVAYAGKLMSGFGAEVLQLGPAETTMDARQAWLHTGKTRASLAELPQETLARLITEAGIVFDGLGAGGLERLGLAPERLRALNPALILVRVAPFGLSGPYRDFEAEEITLYAMSGLMHCTGDGAREPLNATPEVCGFTAGMKAYVAALMAWLRLQRSGLGDEIELSLQETGLDNFEIAISEFLNLGKVARRNNDEHAMVPWRAFPCRDGYATIIGGPIRNWRKGAALFEQPELMGPDFAHMADRIRNRARFRELITPWLMRTDKRTVFHAGQAAGLAWSFVATLADAFDSPQAAARQFFLPVEQPGLGPCQMPDAPFRGSRLRWQTRPATLPLSGAAVASVDWTQPAPAQAKPSAAAPIQPLAGLKVLDFTHDWAGPHAARLLADYGAEVIKIEHGHRLDSMRGADLARIDEHPRFWQLHRGKQSVTLDLKNPEQLACCKALIAECDVVIENSRPGVMARLGLGYDTLKALNPRLVMCSMSAFGATGPEAHYAGYGGTIEALSGLQSMTGYLHNSPFMRIREMDVLNGVMGDCAILTALAERERTGEGQWIDLSEGEACTWMLGEAIIEFSRSREQPTLRGNRDPRFAQGAYPCAGEDRWLVLSLRDDAEWQRFTLKTGLTALQVDARFASNTARLQHHDALDAAIAEWTRTQDAHAAMHLLQSAGLACGVVLTAADIGADPHLRAREWFIEGSDGRFPGFPFRFQHGGGVYRGRGPKLGSGNAALFTRLGLPPTAWPDLSPASLGTGFDEPAESH